MRVPASFNDLNDDVLLHILSFTAVSNPSTPRTAAFSFLKTTRATRFPTTSGLLNLSCASRRLRNLGIRIIFRSIRLEDDKYPDLSRIEEVLERPYIYEYTRSFTLRVKHPRPDSPTKSSKPQLALAITSLLTKIPRLRRLVLRLSDYDARAFAAAFSVLAPAFRHVKELEITRPLLFLLRHCPSLTTLVANGTGYYGNLMAPSVARALIAVAGRSKLLTHLSVCAEWTLDLLSALHHSVPRLVTLEMLSQWNDSLYHADIDAMPLLAKFAYLRRLGAANCGCLGLGGMTVDCEARQRGRRVRSQNSPVTRLVESISSGTPLSEELVRFQAVLEASRHHSVERRERIARLVFGSCLGLQELVIPESGRVWVARRLEGDVAEVVWEVEVEAWEEVLVQGQSHRVRF